MGRNCIKIKRIFLEFIKTFVIICAFIFSAKSIFIHLPFVGVVIVHKTCSPPSTCLFHFQFLFSQFISHATKFCRRLLWANCHTENSNTLCTSQSHPTHSSRRFGLFRIAELWRGERKPGRVEEKVFFNWIERMPRKDWGKDKRKSDGRNYFARKRPLFAFSFVCSAWIRFLSLSRSRYAEKSLTVVEPVSIPVTMTTISIPLSFHTFEAFEFSVERQLLHVKCKSFWTGLHYWKKRGKN